jgi:hypothetical protein
VPRGATACEALTVGQLARRWGVSAHRVRQLALGGRLPGAFVMPSAGRYGDTLKIPLATVVRLETGDWALAPAGAQTGPGPRRRAGGDGPALRHFPGLDVTPGPAPGSRGAAPG